MHEVNARLFYKAHFTLPCSPDRADCIFEQVLSHIYAHYAALSICNIPFSQFRTYAKLESDDHSTKTRIASFRVDSPTKRSVWSFELRFPDASYRRRRWVEHLCVQYAGGEAVTLSYALLYYNNLARSFSSLAAPLSATPEFVRDFVCNEAFFCSVGSYRLPPSALALSHDSMEMFVDLVLRDTGSIPVILIAGAGLINPQELAEAIAGNGIVFYSDEDEVLSSANACLPECLQVAPHAVQVFHPGRPYVQAYGPEAILRLSSPKLVSMIRTGLCEYMDHEERLKLLSVPDVHNARSALRITESINQINTLLQDNTNLRFRNAALQDRNVKLSQQLEEQNTLAMSDPYAEAKQYYEEWTNSQNFYQAMQEQVNEVTAALYSKQPVSISGMPQNAAIAHLVEAVKFRLGQQPGQHAHGTPQDTAS